MAKLWSCTLHVPAIIPSSLAVSSVASVLTRWNGNRAMQACESKVAEVRKALEPLSDIGIVERVRASGAGGYVNNETGCLVSKRARPGFHCALSTPELKLSRPPPFIHGALLWVVRTVATRAIGAQAQQA